MRFAGAPFRYDEDDRVQITDLVLTPGRVSIDFEDYVGTGRLVAESADDVHFTGTYGYPDPEPERRIEFKLYRSADGEALLCGRWWEDGGDEDTWLLHLVPKPKQ